MLTRRFAYFTFAFAYCALVKSNQNCWSEFKTVTLSQLLVSLQIDFSIKQGEFFNEAKILARGEK